MKPLFKSIFTIPLLIICSLSQAQPTETGHLRFSLITCGPAAELYSIWGHTAIRVIDSSSGMDAIFNYGTFDISDPYFYLKFTRGIMQYSLSVESYNSFLQEYKDDHRRVIEQELMLTTEQKERLYRLLKTNALEKNRYYGYQFCEDNCTTRAKGVINKCTNDSIRFKVILAGKADILASKADVLAGKMPQAPPTYRELIHKNLDIYHQYWSKFGIDFLLGSNLDRPVTSEQSMFLPDYLMQGFDSATLQQHPLVSEKKIILKGDYPGPDPGNGGNNVSIGTPFNVFSLLALGFLFLTFYKKIAAKKILKIADTAFFFSLGLLGILIVFVWVGRVDTVCRNNLNLLWTWPTHVVVVFLAREKHPWIKTYFRIAALVAFLILIAWPWLPQQLNIAFVPLLIIIALRGYLIVPTPATLHSPSASSIASSAG